MSELRSALDGITAEDLGALTDAEVEDAFAELQHISRMLEAQLLRCLAEIDRRATFRADGYLSTVSWLHDRYDATGGSAKEQIRVARALEEMPATREVFASGELSRDAVRVLSTAHDVDPETFARDEGLLLDAALRHPMGELQQVVAYWKQGVDGEGRADRQWQERRLFVSHLLDGMVRVDGTLDPENGEAVVTALRAIQDAEARSDTSDDSRTPAQRRADALGELARRFLDRSDRPTVAGERPHVSVTVDIATLKSEAGGVSELAHAGPVAPSIARMLACDGAISRIVMGSRSEPLDVGRRTKVVPAPIRRAVIARDRWCRFPGCYRPPPWCDAHHVVHWADGGSTALHNLVLLCRRHHRLVHRPNGFRMGMVDGAPQFRRPDGSVVSPPTREEDCCSFTRLPPSVPGRPQNDVAGRGDGRPQQRLVLVRPTSSRHR